MDARQPGTDALGARGAPPIPQIHGRVGHPDVANLHHKAVSALSAELPAGEAPRVVIGGLASAAIVATDRRAFVFKSGRRSGLPFGSRLKEFEFESIMRIDLRAAGDDHVVVIHAPLKISVCSSYWADRRDDPWRARNAIPVDPSPDLEAAVAQVSELLAEFQHRRIARRSVRAAERRSVETGTPDLLDRIAKLEADPGPARPVPLPLPPVPAGSIGGPAPQGLPPPRA